MLLDIDKWCKETIINKSYIPEITSSSIKLSNGTYDPNGLFSTDIFGQERSTTWKNQFAKIVLPHPVIHPAVFYIINRRISYLLKWINLEIGYVWRDNVLTLTNSINNFDYCGIIDLYQNSQIVCDALLRSGYFETETAKTILARIVDRKIPIFTSNIIILPPIFRPEDDSADANGIVINKVYTKIIDEVNVLKSSMSGKDKILINRILVNIQNLYNQLFTAMIGKIKGKTGLVRAAMLGKNADFSGRAVIVGDPYIKPSQLGVPRTMLIKLFYPWIINKIITNPELMKILQNLGVACNVANLFNLINTDIFEKNINANIVQVLNKIMEEVIKDKVIIAKRDPVLHKLSVRAFYPIPVDDTSIHICPLVCKGFNADFDGDQMAVFVPLTNKAQNICKNELLATKTLYHPFEGLSFVVDIDFVFGMWIITKDDIDPNDKVINLPDNTDIVDLLFKAERFNIPVTFKGKTNTIGRRVAELIFNDRINVTESLNDKKIKKLLEKIAEEVPNELEDIMYRILKVTSITSSIYGGTMSVKDFKINDELKKRRDDVIAHPDKYDVDTELDKITEEYTEETYKKNQLPTLLVKSGAKGNKSSLKQVAVARGYISDAEGKVLPEPIGSCYADGFSPVDYFTSSYGNRKGVVDRSQNTANSGYLQRQMIYLAAPVKSSDTPDCKTNKFFTILLTEDYVKVVKNRVLSNGDILTDEYIEKNNLIGKKIQLYSPLYCKSHDICLRCYPIEYRKRNPTRNIGMISANIVGEKASQTIMKQFHCLSEYTLVYCKQNDGYSITTLYHIFNKYKDNIIYTLNDTQEEIDLSDENIYTDNNGKWTKVMKIIRHKRNPDSPMTFIKSIDSHVLVSQDNHRIVINRNNDIKFLAPKDIIINKDKIEVSDNNIWQNKNRKSFIDGYLLGCFICNGNSIVTYNKSNNINIKRLIFYMSDNDKQNSKNTIIKDKMVSLLNDNHIDMKRTNKCIIIYDDNISNEFYNKCSIVSKRILPPDFIYYDDDTLSKILCGIIDVSAVIKTIKNYNDCIERINISSINLALINSIAYICDKFDIKYTIYDSKNLTDNINHQRYNIVLFPTNEHLLKVLSNSIKCQNHTIMIKRHNKKNERSNIIKNVDYILFKDDLDEDSYVYDLETEDHQYSANKIHILNTGGAASIKYISKEAPQITPYINQDNNNLVAKKNIRIRVHNYTQEGADDVTTQDFEIIDLETGEEVDGGFKTDIKFNLLMADNSNLSEGDDEAILDYSEGVTVGEISSTATDTTSAVLTMQKVLNHANQFENPDDLVLELYEIFKASSQIPLLFFEVLVSQIIRDPDKKYYPYRYGSMTKPPFFAGIKTVAGLESSKRGIMFEKILDVVTNSVLQGDSSNTDQRVTSDLETLFDI